MKHSSVIIQLPDAAATYDLGRRLGQGLPPGTVLLLEGNLGSGKTTLVQGIGIGLGIEDAIASPTFTLINEYLYGRIPLYHVDLYRLTPAETDSLYLETYWEGQEVEPGILAIEWADRLQYLPTDPLRLLLSYDQKSEDKKLGDQKAGRQGTLTVPESYSAVVWKVLKPDELLAHEV